MLATSIKYTCIDNILVDISNGKTTAATLAEQYLGTCRSLNPQLNAYVRFNEDAVKDAVILDAAAASDRGPLHGVPIAIKDNVETAGLGTSFGNKALKDYVPKHDATLVRRLRQAGAIILGKTTVPDFCTNFFSTSSLTERSMNPYDPSRDTGGSSSGSASAVAAKMAIASIGSDTGGSIRLPASFNGLVGVRMTPGRISRDGLSPLLPWQDSPGPMANNVRDCARILDVVVGFDDTDPWTSVNTIVPPPISYLDVIKAPSIRGRRIGVVRSLFGTDPRICRLLDASLASLSRAGAQLIEVEMPHLALFLQDTFNYESSKTFINEFLQSRPDLRLHSIENLEYHPLLDLLTLIKQAPTNALSSENFCRALLEVRNFQNATASIYARNEVEALVYPTCQVLPPKHEDIFSRRIIPISFPTNTLIAAQLCWPAVTVPVGKVKVEEKDEDHIYLPVGLDILGLPLKEDSLMAVGAAVEAFGYVGVLDSNSTSDLLSSSKA